MVGLSPHPGHRQFPGVIHRLRQDLQFLVLRPSPDLQANVINRRSDHEAQRLEPGLAEQHVLRDRQVRGENARRIGAGSMGQPAVRGLRLPGGRIAGRLTGEKWHLILLRPDSRVMARESLPAGALTARDPGSRREPDGCSRARDAAFRGHWRPSWRRSRPTRLGKRPRRSGKRTAERAGGAVMHPMRYREDGGGADLLFSENRKNRSMPCSAALRDLATTILENPSCPASSTSPSNAKTGCEGWIRMTARAGHSLFIREPAGVSLSASAAWTSAAWVRAWG